ncbi:C25 family cysteine peptidase, partial [bacterium]
MKKGNGKVSTFMLLGLILILITKNVWSTQETKTFIFKTSRLKIEKINGYDWITYDNLDHNLKVGAPHLPVRIVHLPLPPGQEITGITVRNVISETLTGEYELYPVQSPQISSNPTIRSVPPDQAVYTSAEPYPGSVVEIAHRGYLTGYSMGALLVHPVQYIPLEKKLLFHSSIEVVITYGDIAESRQPVRDGNLFESVQNQTLEMLAGSIPADIRPSLRSMSAVSILPPEEHHYVIITSDGLVDAFQPLADWKKKKGLSAEIVTTSWIEANYSGVDTQEKIRNFIMDAQQSWGTIWLLLGGDTGIIPDRKTYAMDCEYGDFSDNYIPCDLYYADFEGDWNANGNEIYGEVDDDVDLYPDIYLGRASVENVTEAEAFVNKILIYEKYAGSSHALDMLFMAGVAWDEPFTDAGEMKDFMDVEFVPPRFDPITKLYSVRHNDDLSTVLAAINAGQNFINHCNHAWINGVSLGEDFLGIPEIDGLTNGPDYGIFFTVGCWPGAFDYDCFGEHFITNPNGGGVAFIGNSRYGWGSPGNPIYGYSDRFDQQFYKALLKDGLQHIGQALAAAKTVFIPFSHQENVYRWHQYQLNLLGDPEMPVWTDAPAQLTVAIPYELASENAQCTVTVTDEGAPVQGAVVCLMQNTSVYQVSITGHAGEAHFSINQASPAELLHITVTAPNYIPYENTIPVQAEGPFVQVKTFTTDGSTEGYVKPGSDVGMDVWFKNFGTETAWTVTSVLRSSSSHIVITDSIVTLPDIAPNDSVLVAGAFSFHTDILIQNGDVAYLPCYVVDGQRNEWIRQLSITGITPVITYSSYTVSDSILGNGNGIAEPGERVHFDLFFRNTGLDLAEDISATISCPDASILFTDTSVNLDSLHPAETASIIVEGVIDDDCFTPSFPRVDIDFSTSGGYQFADSFRITIGNVVFMDDMEDVSQNWTHSGNPDLWHVNTDRKHSGNHSWKCGRIGEYNFDNFMTGNTLISRWKFIGLNSILSFWAWYECPNYGTTGFYVEVNDGSGWTTLDFIGSGGALGTLPTGMDWYKYSYDLSDYPAGSNIQVRFRFQSDHEAVTEGVYIDDVVIQDEQHDIVIPELPLPLFPEGEVYEIGSSVRLSWEDCHDIADIENFNQDNYEFQGYNVYQLASSAPFVSNGVRVATFDIVDGVTDITESIIDPVSGQKQDVVWQHGTDSGIEYEFLFEKDYIEDIYFIQGKIYYFAVTAYTYNADPEAVPHCSESLVDMITFIFQEDLPSPAYGDTLRVDHIVGEGDGTVAPIILDPNVFSGDKYRLDFSTNQSGELTWNLSNLSKQNTVLSKQPLFSTDIDCPCLDGIQLHVKDAQLLDFMECTIDGQGEYSISSHYAHGWASTARAIESFGYGTEDRDELSEDYELRFTGEYYNPNTSIVYVREGTGSRATIAGARYFDLAFHPMNPYPGSSNPFTVRIPFEVWNIDDNQQVNFIIYDRDQYLGNPHFYAFNPKHRMYCWILNTPYHETPVDWAANEQDSTTWNVDFWTTLFMTGDMIRISYENPLSIADVYTFSTADEGSTDDDIIDFQYDLLQNYPNPFNTNTTIKFRLIKLQPVTITIYNMLGKVIRE